MPSDGAVQPVPHACREFVIAKNPNTFSKLPYLLSLPLEGAPLWLKAKDTWPRSGRVYCEQVDTPTEPLNVVEHVGVTLCKRRGSAIDLVLSRAINKRSQFIFTASRGRPIILWQTHKTAQSARPGVRVPGGGAGVTPIICIDTREKYGYRFSQYTACVDRRALGVGDYAAMLNDEIVGVVERKSFDDFVASLTDASLMFAMSELCTTAAAAVVVEGTYSNLLRHAFTAQGFLADTLVRLQLRYPHVPILFLETKKLAEDWTYRFLRTAYNNSIAPTLPMSTDEGGTTSA